MAESKKCNVNETSACCGVDIGTIVDNNDCTINYANTFATKAEAEEMLATLTKTARDAQSDPCEITSTIGPVDGGFKLSADFTFCCGAECMIFQFKLR